MTATELKASLWDSIQSIDDVNVIERITRYVQRTVAKSNSRHITKADLVADPRAIEIVKNLKKGSAIDDKAAMRKHWEEKYR